MSKIMVDSTGTIKKNNKTIGLINYEKNILFQIEIDSSYQNNGFGKSAIREFIYQCKECGYSKVYFVMVTNEILIHILENSFNAQIVSDIPTDNIMKQSHQPHYCIEM